MSTFDPVYRILIGGVNYTSSTLSNLTITSGRTDIYAQAAAGYCYVELVNTTNAAYNFDVGTSITIEVKNTAGTYVALYGGTITDFAVGIRDSGARGTVTTAQITALGALARLRNTYWTGSLSQTEEGTQIYKILSDLLLNSWSEVSASTQWDGYTATTTWANAENVGLGEVDTPGQYTMEARSADPIEMYGIIADIATSGLGYIYEDNQGRIGYADAVHRQNYLAANGYTVLNGNYALGAGVRTLTRSGYIRNDITLNYANNFNSHVYATDTGSIAKYGRVAENINSYLHGSTDAQAVADRRLSLRSYPRPIFDSITFPITNPEIDDTLRDKLLGIFMGMPIRITNLPTNINDGQFEGYVEGWTIRASKNDLVLTLNASPTEFSQVAVQWGQVSASESWNTLLSTLTWQTAIGAVN